MEDESNIILLLLVTVAYALLLVAPLGRTHDNGGTHFALYGNGRSSVRALTEKGILACCE